MGGPYDHGVVNVRRMQSGDISAVIDIETEAFSSPWTEEIYVQLIDQSRVELIVLEEEKAGIIGYAVLFWTKVNWRTWQSLRNSVEMVLGPI